MPLTTTRRLIVPFALLLAAGSANALVISDIDLGDFHFDVTNYDVGSSANGLGGDATASGTSNGVSWSVSPTNLWSGRTTTDGTFNFPFLPAPTDNLHASVDFTITFGETVGNLLLALSNDNTSDSVNFGIEPSDFSGSVTATGTQINTGTGGGLVLLENLNSLTISHTDDNGLSDGFDLAFYVVDTASVPEPGSWILLGTGLLGLGLARRKRVASGS